MMSVDCHRQFLAQVTHQTGANKHSRGQSDSLVQVFRQMLSTFDIYGLNQEPSIQNMHQQHSDKIITSNCITEINTKLLVVHKKFTKQSKTVTL